MRHNQLWHTDLTRKVHYIDNTDYKHTDDYSSDDNDDDDDTVLMKLTATNHLPLSQLDRQMT